jgi:hypothetical protein
MEKKIGLWVSEDIALYSLSLAAKARFSLVDFIQPGYSAFPAALFRARNT